MKTCSKCSVPKPESDFYTQSDKTKLWNVCKLCVCESRREKRREYYFKNKEQITEKRREYYENNREQKKEKSREYYENNREKIKEYYKNKRPKTNKNKKRKYHSDPQFKLAELLRSRLRNAMRSSGGAKKSARTVELLGAPWVWVEAYLEEQFVSGMSWENHGPVWEIDHIRPCASFDLTDPEQQKMCFHWTNLQPLFTPDNRRKSDTYDPLNV